MKTPPSSYQWLEQDALQVAPRLIGWELISRAGGQETGGRIVEAEVYHGSNDPASHAHRGRTPRTAPMFAAGGGVYVYLSYGMHTCLNIVTGPAGWAQAILIRALEPTIGQALMASRRGLTNPRLLTSGPGRLAQALGITLGLSGSRLGDVLELRPPQQPVDPGQIATGPRIGIKKAIEHPWRFYLPDSPYVSVKGAARG